MSDSIENRIKLYGLYKQSTEGDLRHIQPPITRPVGTTTADENAQRKFDAWKQQEGLSRTQAKRLYISFLISTMKIYGSGTMEARELLGELEYLWEQIKDVQSDGTVESDLGTGTGSVSRSVSYNYQKFGQQQQQQQQQHSRIPSTNLHSLNNSTLTGGGGGSITTAKSGLIGANNNNGGFLESYIHENSTETDGNTGIRYELREMNRQLLRVVHQLNQLARGDKTFAMDHNNSDTHDESDARNYKLFKTVMRFLSSGVCKIVYELAIFILMLKVYKFCKSLNFQKRERVWKVYLGYMEKVVDFLM
ncbi:hypothetical protein WICPIJ_003463 [Wickerhamomyces pijperi]|uniref:ACB domain-containing protein n=1 Tax=Wickerhamomyces pijperi TaxID=599730 RepID=A0A9P8Q731_WICPI|nr:hypothetical protein WICPIJ_003463 [Wickerhamomyces pijperi]